MPVQTADRILSSYWDGNIPVNLYDIVSKLGVAVMTDPSLIDASGHYRPNGFAPENPPIITYSPTEHPVRQRFTIAHELGHHVLNHGERNRDTPNEFMSMNTDPAERAANTFAAELLMPASAVRAMVEVRKITDVGNLASLFHVSRPAMTFRLRGLGYAVN